MEYIVILIFLTLSAFFSGSEIAFISASKLGVELKKSSGSRRGRIISGFYNRAENFLGAMLIGNNIALVALTYFMTRLLEPMISQIVGTPFLLLLLVTLIITVIVLVFGEFLPKTIFRLHANQALFIGAYPLSFFRSILHPMSWFVIKISKVLLRGIFGKREGQKDHGFTRHDLERYVSGSVNEANEELDTDLFRNALNLKELKVRDCMIPRTEIVYIDVSANYGEIVTTFRQTSHSRILVIDGDIDHVIGYLHHQSLFFKKSSIRKMMMNILIVPEVLNIKDLLMRFIRERINIACVVDEYGGTSGLITLEDVLEELFGEIEDEHDNEELIEQKISEDEFLFSGRLEIDYLNEKYEEIFFPEGEYLTLSGYLTMVTGNIPDQGASIEVDGYRFIMELVSDKKIETVRVKIPTEKDL
nr:HlyC/CorC family transporter [Saprospiraceae bacterium]